MARGPTRRLLTGRARLAGLLLITVALAAAAASAPAPAAPRFWAVCIGISDYPAERGVPPLGLASADARAVAELLRAPAFGAGGIPAERLLLLTDAEATRARVGEALSAFLGRAAPEDVVLVFFAGHGAPDPFRPDDLYLLAHDSDPRRLPATAIPLAEVARALTQIRAERVLVFMDACHSAGIVPPGLRFRAVGEANPVNTRLAELARGRRNRLIVTASGAGERSMEGARWQHGVFTWALLRGLRGAADARGDRDGVVQLGELVSYVRDEVERATGRRQHPVVSGEYAGRLPLALAQRGGAADEAPAEGAGAAPAGQVTAAALLDLGAYTIEPIMRRPLAFYALPRRAAEPAVTAAERALAPRPLGALTDGWVQARRAVYRAESARRTALDALTEGWRPRLEAARAGAEAQPRGAPGAAALEAQYERARRALDARTRAQVDAAEARRRAALGRLLGALGAFIEERPAAVPGGYWLVAAEAALDRSLDQLLAAVEEFDRRARAFERTRAGSLPVQPQRDLRPALRFVDRFLDTFRTHPQRAEALYLRAWLAEEAGEPAAAVAGHCLQAVAEYPDHAFGAELYLRMANGYAEAGDPQLAGLTTEAYRAALAHAPRGHALRADILLRLGLWLYRQGELAAARARFLELIGEAAPRSEAGGDARAFVAVITNETLDPAPVEGAALLPATRAELLAASAAAAAGDGDDVRAADWLARALALDPDGAAAADWDRRRADALAHAGRVAEAARALAGRARRFGPSSAWYRRHGGALPAGFLRSLERDAERADELRAAKRGPRVVRPLDVAQLFVRRRLRVFARCLDHAQRARQRATGPLQLELQWDGTGAIIAGRVTRNQTGSDALGACLLRQVGRGRLPGIGPGGARVQLVFREL